MIKLIFASLILNILVLIPVCAGFVTTANWVVASYGINTPSKGILLSVYLAILISSIILLFYPDPKLVAALLLVQIIYKFSTPFTVGSFSHPVVVSNLLIALFHTITLISIWKSIKM